MDKCREEFEQAFPVPAHWIEYDEKSNRYYCPYVADATASTYQSKWVVWQHQQAKVEELQKQNAWLSDIAERENKRANKLKEEHVSTTILLGKVEQQKVELQKQLSEYIFVAETIDEMYLKEVQKSDELQKRVDALELKLREIAGIARRARHGEYHTESGRNAGLNIAGQIEHALKGEG
ncbi:hypothetical protein DU202_02849 [Acinetobacter baumannii DU202]|nr:hypothetical protein DU202_02849 [Acinetobacter baumannii DU202]